jgi:hypothetical protein
VAGGGGGGANSCGGGNVFNTYHITNNYFYSSQGISRAVSLPRCHSCGAFDASQQVEGLFILPGGNPLNPAPGVDLALGLPGSCASLAAAAAAQGTPPVEVAAMLPCLAHPTFLLLAGANYTILGPAASLRLAAMPEDCSGK